jgi:hypothetical protein
LKRFLSFLLLSTVAGQLEAAAPGLIDQPQTFPWSVGLTPVVQEEAGGLSADAWRIKTSVLWFNTYRQSGLGKDMVQQIDMEGLLETVSAAWSPTQGWELRGQVQGWELGGGVMDYMLSGFHGVLYLPNQGRNFTPENQYRDYLAGSFDLTDPPSGVTQASLGIRWFSGPWSWTAWVKPPVPGAPDWGWSDRWSGGLGAGAGDRWSWDSGVVLAGGLSGALILVDRDPKFPGGTGAPTVQAGFYSILESPWLPRFLVQGTWTKMPREGKTYLGDDAGLLTSGFQGPLGRSWTWELALTEEFFTWATMEVGFQAGLTWNP